MPLWIALPAYMLGSLTVTAVFTWFVTRPAVVAFWERHRLEEPLIAILVISVLWVLISTES